MLEGFMQITLLEGNTFMTVTSKGIKFNGNVVYRMQKAEYVHLLLNFNKNQLAIQKCQKQDNYSVLFLSRDKNWNWKNGVQLKNQLLQPKISNVMDWNLAEYNYRIDGIFSEEDNAVIFDLNSARKLHKRKSRKIQDKNIFEV